jgi:hypothetical protein
MNHEDTKNTKEEGGRRKKKNLFTRQLVLDRLLENFDLILKIYVGWAMPTVDY